MREIRGVKNGPIRIEVNELLHGVIFEVAISPVFVGRF